MNAAVAEPAGLKANWSEKQRPDGGGRVPDVDTSIYLSTGWVKKVSC